MDHLMATRLSQASPVVRRSPGGRRRRAPLLVGSPLIAVRRSEPERLGIQRMNAL